MRPVFPAARMHPEFGEQFRRSGLSLAMIMLVRVLQSALIPDIR
jgi:hypothetical protein